MRDLYCVWINALLYCSRYPLLCSSIWLFTPCYFILLDSCFNHFLRYWHWFSQNRISCKVNGVCLGLVGPISIFVFVGLVGCIIMILGLFIFFFFVACSKFYCLILNISSWNCFSTIMLFFSA